MSPEVRAGNPFSEKMMPNFLLKHDEFQTFPVQSINAKKPVNPSRMSTLHGQAATPSWVTVSTKMITYFILEEYDE